jgi:mono/diheme cytochrome c family protein
MRSALALMAFLAVGLVSCGEGGERAPDEGAPAPGEGEASAPSSRDPVPAGDPVAGREIFRFDTFGDERFWTDTLRMHEVIQSSVDPLTALAVGLKVDSEALPPGILGQVDLSDPATTVALLEMNAVVGLKAEVVDGRIQRVGVTCALCHSDVDDSVQEGIGRRLDGHPNRDLDPGKILSLSPALQDPAVQAVLTSWGPGMYDAYWNHDNLNDPTVIPAAYGLNGVPVETFTGEAPVSYWNAYVAVTQMHGQGSFRDPEMGIEIVASPDLVTPKLPDLQAYQLTLAAPTPPPGSFDAAAAARGEEVFRGRCASCHIPPTFTDAGEIVHEPSETGMDPGLAERGTTGGYRTTPLRGAWERPPYFHDGSAATLEEVVDHYDDFLDLGLSAQQKADLVEYLKSL